MHRSIALAGALLIAACAATDPDTSETAQAIASFMGKFEFALDAPWRVERPPRSTGAYTIPIQLSVHDVNVMKCDDDGEYEGNPEGFYGIWYSEDVGRLGMFHHVEVEETYGGTTTVRTYALTDLHEIEATHGSWLWPTTLPDPESYLCRIWNGEACDARAWDLAKTSEWHAILFYTPKETAADARVELRVRLVLERIGASQLMTSSSYTFPPVLEPSKQAVLENSVNVYLAQQPLPRFDSRWAYGDLHYHAQGTDNEGESAYAYRGVVQGARSLGLDFVFATDHASNSEQFIDIDKDLAGLDINSEPFGLRDSSPGRYSHNMSWVNGPNGANAEVFSAGWSVPARPTQVFLGGEVDVIPEVSDAEQAVHEMHYGNGLVYRYTDACGDLPEDLKWWYGTCQVPGSPLYVEEHDRLDVALAPGHWGIKDPQGVLTWDYFARQHLISLPHDPDPTGFVSSSTSKYGGATRRLSEVIATNYDGSGKAEAFFFLAHPMARDSGSGEDRVGPDIVPYTQIQLDTAFATRHFLGLQLWNEDIRFETKLEDRRHDGRAYPDQPPSQSGPDGDFAYTGEAWLQPWADGNAHTWNPPLTDPPLYSALHHGAFTWDKLLRMGLDPVRTSALGWLQGGGIRKIFMAGGSDSHGDFNYRRTGGIGGTSSVVDSAIGKPRNLVFAGNPQGAPIGRTGISPFTQQQVVSALSQGQFSVTDGPAVRIAIDTNANGIIDDTDLGMGSIVDYPAGKPLPVLVEWKSTDEFGELFYIELYVGGFSDVNRAGATYAPALHGVRSFSDPSGNVVRSFVVGSKTYNRLGDGYIQDPAPSTATALRFYGSGLTGTHQFLIDPAAFPIPVDDPNSFTNPLTPDRLYVRAFVRTKTTRPSSRCLAQHTDCINRLAFTNPIWARRPTIVTK